jgi:hypothetical protein
MTINYFLELQTEVMKQVTLYGARRQSSRLKFQKTCLYQRKLSTLVFRRPLITACCWKGSGVNFRASVLSQNFILSLNKFLYRTLK